MNKYKNTEAIMALQLLALMARDEGGVEYPSQGVCANFDLLTKKYHRFFCCENIEFIYATQHPIEGDRVEYYFNFEKWKGKYLRARLRLINRLIRHFEETDERVEVGGE